MKIYTNYLADLKTAQAELIEHHKELAQCTAELKIANEHINLGETEQLKQTTALNNDLENMLFSISHKVRKSVANIIGISKLLYDDNHVDIIELRELLRIIILSAESLNLSTEELSKLIHKNKRD